MRSPGRSTSALWSTVVLAGGVEGATAVATQVRAVRYRSPWQDDPYNTAVSFALVGVPVLALLLAARLVGRAATGRPRDAAALEQMSRAGLTLCATIDLLACSEWAAVATGAHRPDWNAVTAGLVAALAVATLAAAGLTSTYLRGGPLRRTAAWDTDWLDDLAAVLARLPGAGRADPAGVIAWTRRRALVVFAAGSGLGAFIVVGALAFGERWTDPWLITWALAVETTSNLAVCLIGNLVVGFVARPPSRRPELEVALAVGCLAVQVAVAFHAQLWTALTGRAPDGVAALVLLTGGAAVIGAAAAYPLVRRRRGAGMAR